MLSTGGKDAEMDSGTALIVLDGSTDEEMMEELVAGIDELDVITELDVTTEEEVDGATEEEVEEIIEEVGVEEIDEEVTGGGIGIHGAVSQTAQTDGLSEVGGAAS